MNMSEFISLAEQHRLRNVNFIESGCGPMVIQVEYGRDAQTEKDLIKDENGVVITCKNVGQAYDICHRAGVHRANLVQVVPHDEACSSGFADYHSESIPLRF